MLISASERGTCIPFLAEASKGATVLLTPHAWLLYVEST
jgi:hypothetical protein|eukprot:COSAG02_NODE_472_length_21636_cov_767.911366_4_plen_39_part_00